MKYFNLFQTRDKWWVIVNILMKFRLAEKAGRFRTVIVSVSFIRC